MQGELGALSHVAAAQELPPRRLGVSLEGDGRAYRCAERPLDLLCADSPPGWRSANRIQGRNRADRDRFAFVWPR